MASSDETLGQRVRSFLRACGYTEAKHSIDVDVQDGVVVLSGWVAEAIDVRIIGTLLSRLDGMVALKNLLPARAAGSGGMPEPPAVSTDLVARLTVGMR